MTEDKRLACEECGKGEWFEESYRTVHRTLWQQKADGTWIKGPTDTGKERQIVVKCIECQRFQSIAWAEKFLQVTQDYQASP